MERTTFCAETSSTAFLPPSGGLHTLYHLLHIHCLYHYSLLNFLSTLHDRFQALSAYVAMPFVPPFFVFYMKVCFSKHVFLYIISYLYFYFLIMFSKFILIFILISLFLLYIISHSFFSIFLLLLPLSPPPISLSDVTADHSAWTPAMKRVAPQAPILSRAQPTTPLADYMPTPPSLSSVEGCAYLQTGCVMHTTTALMDRTKRTASFSKVLPVAPCCFLLASVVAPQLLVLAPHGIFFQCIINDFL